MKKAAFFSLNNQLSNASTVNFIDAFNVPVTTAGAGTQCVLIQYSSEMSLLAATDQNVSGSFRTLLDGVVTEGHNAAGNNFVSPDDATAGRFEVVAFHHWKCGVPAGVHTIQVQFKPATGANEMLVRGRSLTVQFKK